MNELRRRTLTTKVPTATSKNDPPPICSSRRQLPKQLVSLPKVVEQAVVGIFLVGKGHAMSFTL